MMGIKNLYAGVKFFWSFNLIQIVSIYLIWETKLGLAGRIENRFSTGGFFVTASVIADNPVAFLRHTDPSFNTGYTNYNPLFTEVHQ